MKPIAFIRTDLPQKFGLPRQSGLARDLEGTIQFTHEYSSPLVVEGLEDFTHLWIIWAFENGKSGGRACDVASDRQLPFDESGLMALEEGFVEPATGENWQSTVRPPRLGGEQRKGVFATRSPFRPNPIGLSCVRIESIEIGDQGPLIHVLGADLRDGTPIYDIKPYLPYADCHPDASGGFTDSLEPANLVVLIDDDLASNIPDTKFKGLLQVLEQDPRPVGTKKPGKVYCLSYAGLEVRFVGDGDVLTVTAVNRL